MSKYLIDEAGKWYRFASVRLAMFAGVVAAWLAAYPDEVEKLLALIPDPWRPVASLAIGLFVFGTATGVRLVRQDGGKGPR